MGANLVLNIIIIPCGVIFTLMRPKKIRKGGNPISLYFQNPISLNPESGGNHSTTCLHISRTLGVLASRPTRRPLRSYPRKRGGERVLKNILMNSFPPCVLDYPHGYDCFSKFFMCHGVHQGEEPLSSRRF